MRVGKMKIYGKDHKEILEKAKECYDKAQKADNDNIEQGKEDVRFYSGLQWDESVKRDREEKGLLTLTNNMLPAFCAQLIGDQQRSEFRIKVSILS